MLLWSTKQEAQLLLERPPHATKSIFLEVNVIKRKYPIANHNSSHCQENIGDFRISDLEMTPKGHSKAEVKTHFHKLGNGEHFCPEAPLA